MYRLGLLCGLFLWFLCGGGISSVVWAEDDAARSYFQGLRYLKEKQWKEAEQALARTFVLLEKKQAPKGRAADLLTLGRCDVLFLRAQAAEGEKDAQKACQMLDEVQRRIRAIPAGWTAWSVNPVLPSRMEQAHAMFQRCAAVETTVSLTLQPESAKAEALLSKKPGDPPRWTTITGPFSLLQEQVSIRAKADGYAPIEKVLPIRRWHPQRFTIQLKALPKPTTRPIPRLALIRRPPPPLKQALPVGWIVGGVVIGTVVIAGAVVGGIFLARALEEDRSKQKRIVLTPVKF